MSPRPYKLGKRQEQIDESRGQVLDAARDLLREADSYGEFTVEAVARRAKVARTTVYYQFKSKTGLLEGLCDQLSALGGTADLAEVLTEPDPHAALVAYVSGLAGLWQADRTVMRRLFALAALDPEVESVIVARDQRRERDLAIIVGRFVEEGGAPQDLDLDQTVRTLVALTGFPTFDALEPKEADLGEARPIILALAHTALRGL